MDLWLIEQYGKVGVLQTEARDENAISFITYCVMIHLRPRDGATIRVTDPDGKKWAILVGAEGPGSAKWVRMNSTSN